MTVLPATGLLARRYLSGQSGEQVAQLLLGCDLASIFGAGFLVFFSFVVEHLRMRKTIKCCRCRASS
jgi:hypothetical protein